MADRTCVIDGCEREHYGRGWCRVHYQRWRRTGDPQAPSRREPGPPRTCTIADCDAELAARGWCLNHWQKWRRWGDPLGGPPPKPQHCSIEDCERPPVTRGYCGRHYTRWLLHGDPLGVADKSVPNRHETRGDGVGVLVITRRDSSEVRCLYDAADHDVVAARQWYIVNGYVCRNTEGGRGNTRVTSLHRTLFGLGLGDPGVVDHISGDRLDCRRRNLRVGDHGLNGENRAVINELGTSRYRGVCRDRGMWKAYTKIAGRMHNIGRYPTEQEAADAVAAYRAERGVNAGYPRKHAWTPSKGRDAG